MPRSLLQMADVEITATFVIHHICTLAHSCTVLWRIANIRHHVVCTYDTPALPEADLEDTQDSTAES